MTTTMTTGNKSVTCKFSFDKKSLPKFENSIMEQFVSLFQCNKPFIVIEKDYEPSDNEIFKFTLLVDCKYFLMFFKFDEKTSSYEWYHATSGGLVLFDPIKYMKKYFLEGKFKLQIHDKTDLTKADKILKSWNLAIKSSFDNSRTDITNTDIIETFSVIPQADNTFEPHFVEFQTVAKFFKWAPYVLLHSNEEFSESLLLNNLPEFEKLMVIYGNNISTCSNFTNFADVYFDYCNKNPSYIICFGAIHFCLRNLINDNLINFILTIDSSFLRTFFKDISFVGKLNLHVNRYIQFTEQNAIKMRSKCQSQTTNNFCSYMAKKCTDATIAGLFGLFLCPLETIRKIGSDGIKSNVNALIMEINPKFWRIINIVNINTHPWRIITMNFHEAINTVSQVTITDEIAKLFIA